MKILSFLFCVFHITFSAYISREKYLIVAKLKIQVCHPTRFASLSKEHEYVVSFSLSVLKSRNQKENRTIIIFHIVFITVEA